MEYELLKNRRDVLYAELTRAQNNVDKLKASVAAVDKLIADADALGVKPKPKPVVVEDPVEESKTATK